jgi:MFS family permease
MGAVGSVAATYDSEALSIYKLLALWRLVLGIGIGGECPLSAAITAENAPSHLKV